MFSKSDLTSRNIFSVSKIRSNKPLLIKLATILVMIFAMFSASPSYATAPSYIVVDIQQHSHDQKPDHLAHADYDNDGIPDNQEKEREENAADPNTPEALAKICNHDWWKQDHSSDNGVDKTKTYTYFYHKTAEEIYDLKPGSI